MENVLGIEIGGTKLQLLVTDQQLKPLKEIRSQVERSSGANGIQRAIEEAIREIESFGITSIGVGFGGPIDKHTGKIFTSYHIEGWSDFPIKEWLEKISGCKVFADNDANVAALGEALCGAGKDFKKVFYVTLGSGVGAGFVENKKIYHGSTHGETEFGHIRLTKDGLTVQDACSGWAVNEKIRNAIQEFPNTQLNMLTKNLSGNESAALAQAVVNNDKIASSIFNEMVDDLSFGLSHAVHLFNPETIILGGGLSLMGELLRKNIEDRIRRYVMDAFQPGPVIQLSLLKENSVPVGAAALAINSSRI